jgi:hypothetical protein
MKIAFITSCLEPGRDGVGDYASVLAGECAARGHDVALLALNDPYAGQANASTGTLRLAGSLPWEERITRARDFLKAFGPDAVSLQFVCFGFHPRGVDPFLASRLCAIAGIFPVHVMFHEIWIGATKRDPWKHRVLGRAQRFLILRILKALDVRVVHTSNQAYAALLRRRGVKAGVLPLFGSIPLPPPRSPARVRGEPLEFGMFGMLHCVWPPEPLLPSLIATGKRIGISHVGKMGEAGEALWERISSTYGGAIEFRRLGEQSPERVAEFFRREIDFGIATTPWGLIGKSASVAAMLEHGLPVVVNRDDWHADFPLEPNAAPRLLVKMDDAFPASLFAVERAEPHSMLPEVAARFLADLEEALR